jgi:glycosyltransferase involved in cell wall biosynthesis
MHYPNWICCQLGAREHYAVPRALYSRGALAKLVTDFWSSPGSTYSRVLPSSLKQDLRGRYHPGLADADVEGLNFSALKFESISRMRRQTGWTQTMARNRWFQRKVVSVLSSSSAIPPVGRTRLAASRTDSFRGGQPVLFAYSYAALELLKHAKKHDWQTVLGQIDPGPVEEKIVAEEVAREPELGATWQPAPQAYWDLWMEECNLADRIVVNSKWSRDAMEKAGISSEKIRIIPLAYERPAETNIFKRSYPDEFDDTRSMRVLFLGQINLRKGVARLLKAIRLLKNEPIEFHFVGPLQISIPQDMQNNPRIHWIGAVSRSEAAAFYRNADILIFPTLSDGFGLTQLEAQAWSLPIVASRFCGVVVEDGRNGLLLEDLNAETIASAVCQCLANPKLLVRFARNSVELRAFLLTKLGEALLESR